MVTDFRTFAGKGLRHITIGDKDSLADYGALITKDTKTDDINAKSATEDLPHMDGLIENSVEGGRLYFEPRVLQYKFKLAGTDTADLESKRRALSEWLKSTGKCSIKDSKYKTIVNNVTTNWLFYDCVLKYIEYEAGEKSSEIEWCYITATFACNPNLMKEGTINERVCKYAKTGNSTLTVTNNASYSIDGGTAKSFSVQSPYTYRFEAYTENTPTVTLNGSALALDIPFIMPASATIAITHSGYGYYELWHDTREEVSP